MFQIRRALARHRGNLLVIILSFALGAALAWGWFRGPVGQPVYSAPPALQDLEDAFSDISNRITPSVVNISSEQRVARPSWPFDDESFRRFFGPERFFGPQQREWERRTSLGSGVIVDKEGYILTNVHVVQGLEEESATPKITVTLSEGKEYQGKIVGTDSRTDLAVIKIEAGKSLPAATLGDADKSKVGSWAIAVGSPFGFSGTITVGVISAKGRDLQIGSDRNNTRLRNMLQTDASINPGNSGGPLVNLQGEIIGINNIIVSPFRGNVGLGFAISVNSYTKRIIKTLMEGQPFVRGRLGIAIQPLNEALQEVYGVKEGVFVTDVDPNTAAEKAGIKGEDIIVEYHGQKVKDPEQLVDLVEQTKPETTVEIKLIRNGKPQTLSVTVGKAEAEVARPQPEKVTNKFGLTVQQITPELAERYNLPVKQGVVVVGIEPDGLAARIGITTGDLLIKINRTSIRNMSDYSQAIEKLQAGGWAVIRFQRGSRIFTVTIRLSK